MRKFVTLTTKVSSWRQIISCNLQCWSKCSLFSDIHVVKWEWICGILWVFNLPSVEMHIFSLKFRNVVRKKQNYVGKNHKSAKSLLIWETQKIWAGWRLWSTVVNLGACFNKANTIMLQLLRLFHNIWKIMTLGECGEEKRIIWWSKFDLSLSLG